MSVAYDYVETVVMWITSIIFVILNIHHSINGYKYMKKHDDITCQICSLFFFSFIVVGLGLSLCLFGTFHTIFHHIAHESNDIYCDIFVIFLVNIYTTFKAVGYIALALRLKESFKDPFTVFYSNNFYIFWISLITVLVVLLQIVFFITFNWPHAVNGRCDGGKVPIYIYAWLVLQDFFICGVNLYLYLRPLCVLTKQSGSKEFKVIIRTNAMLASISMISTIIVWLILIGTGGAYAMIYTTVDCATTSVCIALLFQWNQDIRHKLCCCCLKWIKAEADHDIVQINATIEIGNATNAESLSAKEAQDSSD
eukprot:508054_1